MRIIQHYVSLQHREDLKESFSFNSDQDCRVFICKESHTNRLILNQLWLSKILPLLQSKYMLDDRLLYNVCFPLLTAYWPVILLLRLYSLLHLHTSLLNHVEMSRLISFLEYYIWFSKDCYLTISLDGINTLVVKQWDIFDEILIRLIFMLLEGIQAINVVFSLESHQNC
jgi:hypothetical protein